MSAMRDCGAVYQRRDGLGVTRVCSRPRGHTGECSDDTTMGKLRFLDARRKLRAAKAAVFVLQDALASVGWGANREASLARVALEDLDNILTALDEASDDRPVLRWWDRDA